MVKYTRRGLVVKRPGVLSEVQMLNLVFGVGGLSLLPIFRRFLEVPFGGFRVQGAQKHSSCRATEGTPNT